MRVIKDAYAIDALDQWQRFAEPLIEAEGQAGSLARALVTLLDAYRHLDERTTVYRGVCEQIVAARAGSTGPIGDGATAHGTYWLTVKLREADAAAEAALRPVTVET